MKIIWLSFLTFVIVVASVLTTSSINKENVVVKNQVLSASSSAEQKKVLIPVLTYNTYPVLSAQAVLAVDLDSDSVLYEKNPDLPLLPASTTKIVAAMVAMDSYLPSSVITINNIEKIGQTMGLVTGEEISVDSLLRGLLIASANDAAEALAHDYPGGRSAFILAMNDKADKLNLDNTVFKNPSGLEEEGHVSTARDLIRVSEVAMEYPYFAEIVRIKETSVTSIDGNIKHRLVNINELLGQIDGVLGVKTGWTENARENLITYLERDGRRLMLAVLGSQDRFGETKELIEWIFENYHWEEYSVPQS
jgi:D-alanyl-D-alanine carboxypeptidase (penicillin-binding protein 5/6)